MLKRFFSFPRLLTDVLDTLDLSEIPAETIMALWHNIHIENPKTVIKTISSFDYKIIASRLQDSPSFMFLSKKNFQKTTLITENIEENCYTFSNIEDPECTPLMILRLFPEIAELKRIVPMRGDIIDGAITKKNAEILLNSFVEYYLDSDLYAEFTEIFNKDFGSFDYGKFIKNHFKDNN